MWEQHQLKNNHKMKAYLPLIIIAICIGVYFLYISPTYTEVQVLRAEKARADLVLRSAKEIVSTRDSLLAKYNSIDLSNFNRLKITIPENFNSITLLSYLNAITTKYNMSISNIKITNGSLSVNSDMPQISISPYKISTVSFSVKGTYAQFVQMIKDIQSSLYLFDITSLSIKNSSESKSVSSFVSEYDIEFNTYSLN